MAGLSWFACRGFLLLDETTYIGQPCVAPADCGAAGTCLEQVCVGVVTGAWCDCPSDQGCLAGRCVGVTNDNACEPTRPQGACAGNAVCVAGTCVPITAANQCSALLPDGLCPPGAACADGRCVLIATVACSRTQPYGLCPAGERCASEGVCETVPCSPEHLAGACPIDQICNAGSCELLPCGPLHVHGGCDDGDTCSSRGACIPIGTCAVAADCGDYFACRDSVCVRDYDCDDANDCPFTEHCASGGQCLPLGECVPGGDVTDCDALESCASTGQCIAEGTCLGDEDCDNVERCSQSAPRTCIADGQCAVGADCPPGHLCNAPLCEVTGTLCTSNEGTAELDCPGGQTCCPLAQRCSSAGSCIYAGSCVDGGDCLADYFACSTDYQCVALHGCGECLLTDRCSTATGACLPGGTTPTRCVTDADCPPGELCNARYECQADASCGATEPVSATRVEPNMLIVLDRSGSMNRCIGTSTPTSTRWNIARTALTDVMAANATSVFFGLSTYPYYCPGATVCGTTTSNDCNEGLCTNSCDWVARCGNPCAALTNAAACARFPGTCTWNATTCGWLGGAASESACDAFAPCAWSGTACAPRSPCPTPNNCAGGDVDVAVGPGRAAAIGAALAPPDPTPGPQHPGGYTPTGRTLRNIAANLGVFGLPDPSDPIVRNNFILLVTDGDANEDGGTYGVCDGAGYTAASRVNCALAQLRSHSPSVRTFVVGFASDGSPANLNCHAVHGGTSRCAPPSECLAITDTAACGARLGCTWSGSCSGGVDADNCATTSATCYFDAQDAAGLSTAFASIAGEVASCTYTLAQAPEAANYLYVYLRDGGGTEVRIEPGPDGWAYDIDSNQVALLGSTCETVKAGLATPKLYIACVGGGG
ncbi:MAG: hypothetical protein AAB426_14410, partial [Myxococcota bacterium]